MKSKPTRRAPGSTAGYGEVADGLRQRIIEGHWRPGERLPPWSRLQAAFGTTPVTLQRAVQALTADGYLRTKPRAGTFVCDLPPHLNNYALVFWNDPNAPDTRSQWSRYYTALTNEALRLQETDGRRVILFHGIDYHTDSPDRQRLQGDIANRRLAGILFANMPVGLQGTPILDEPGLPRLTLASHSSNPNVRVVAFDNRMWLDKALAFMAAQGRRRVAVLTHALDEGFLANVADAFGRRRLKAPSHWVQAVNPNDPFAASHCAQLLMYGPPAGRPDGLLIADDNLVEGAMAGLVAAGIRAPADLAIVAHSNFPWPPSCPLAARRLGYDISAVLRTCLDLIDRQRRGETLPPTTTIPAQFEDELVAAREGKQPTDLR